MKQTPRFYRLARKTQASFRSEVGFMPASGEKNDCFVRAHKAIGVRQ